MSDSMVFAASSGELGSELAILGAAFLLCGYLARAGRRIGLPTIPLFMLAGIIAGPFTPGPVLFDRAEDVALLGAFGLIFLLFYLGIEFSLDDLTAGGSRLLGTGATYLALNMVGGLLLGLAIGWGAREAIVIAGVTGISSSAIVTKLLVELRRLNRVETPIILGVIVIEDVFLALYLAALAPVLGQAETVADGAMLFGRAALFLVVLGAIARYGANMVGQLVTARDDELTTVLFVGFALLVAGVAAQLGVSEAIGAFLAGLVLGSSEAKHRIERLVLPLRDAFGAVFFLAFGLAIDPGALGEVAGPAAAAVVLSVTLAMVAGVFAARINRLGRIEAASIGCSVLARGEFALILVSLAVAAQLDPRLTPFAGAYVLVLALASPVMATNSDRIATLLPTRLFPTERAGAGGALPGGEVK